MSELSPGGTFDPNDPAHVDEFLAAADAFLEATAAEKADVANIKAEVDAEVAQVSHDVVAATRRHGIINFSTEDIEPSSESQPAHTEEQLIALQKARWLAACIVQLRDFGDITDPEEVRTVIGKALVGIEDPEQTQAWLGVLKDIFQPYVHLDEILGPEPEITVLQLVAAEEENIERRGMFYARMATAKSLIDEYFREFGEHDDLEDAKRHILSLSTLNDDEPSHGSRALLDSIALIDSARQLKPEDPDFLATLRRVVDNIRTEIFDLPPIEAYLPPDWEQYLNDEDEQ
jgi:hypothetical protein